MSKEIFVFGSNLAGVHGAGAARYARMNHGAKIGQGVGLQGTSYALPTKDERIKTLPLDKIAAHVSDFLDFARRHPEYTFNITPVGCGLAGYKRAQIKPLFGELPANCFFNQTWQDQD